MRPLRCPWCGHTPSVLPEDPEKQGNVWGAVVCENEICPAKPRVEDGEDIADERGSEEYKKAAIRRWNTRY